MTNLTYDVYYFIAKFAAISEEKWCSGAFNGDGGTHCALGFCSAAERDNLRVLLDYTPDYINDGYVYEYPQPTPKKRILAALRDVACSQLGEDAE